MDDDRSKGIYKKYTVTRLNDPNDKHTDCEYFVLDFTHDKFAPAALRAYAAACASEYPRLAADLLNTANFIARLTFIEKADKGPEDEAPQEMCWGHAEHRESERSSEPFATRKEAIEDGRKTYGADASFVIRPGYKPIASMYVPDINWILDEMGELAGDEAGEVAEDFPKVDEAGRDALEVLLEAWADTFVPVDFWISEVGVEQITPETVA
jgi:hypothetical protein